MGAKPLELTIVLKGDNSGLTGTVRVSAEQMRELGKTIEDVGKKGEAAGRKLEESGRIAERAGKVMGAAAAAAAAGYAFLVKNAIDAADGVYNVSQRLAIGAEVLSTFHVLAQKNGVAVGEFDARLGSLAETAARAAGGSKQQVQLFRDMGIAATDARGKVKPLGDLLPEIASKFAQYEDGPAKAALANKLFGEGGAALIPMLNDLGDRGFAKAREEAEKLGLVIDSNTAKAAHELKDQIDALKMTTDAYFNRVARDVLPNLILFATGLNDQARAATESNDKTTVLGNGIRTLVTWLIEGYGWAQRFGAGLADAIARAELEFEKLKVKFTSADWLTAFTGAIRGDPLATSSLYAMNAAADAKFAGRTKALDDAAAASFADIDANVARHVAAINQSIESMGATTEAASERVRAGTAPLAEYGRTARDTGSAIREQANSMQALIGFADQLAGKMGGPLDAAIEQYAASLERADRLAENALINGNALDDVLAQHSRAYANAAAVLDKRVGQIAAQTDVEGDLLRKMDAEIVARMKGTAALKAEQVARDAVMDEQRAGIKYTEAEAAARASAIAEEITGRIKLAEALDFAEQFDGSKQFDKLVESIGVVEDALKKATDPEIIARFRRELDNLNEGMQQRHLSFLRQGVSSLQQFAKEGTAAYTALGIAQDILAYKSAVAAIANQGSGDPYSAFARIAAMIALMASIGIRVAGGGNSGPSAQSAEVRQAQQGTGSVLGDATAKSESIAKATEITANATEQLVGLNRGMLNALVSLQTSLGAAGNQLARGAGDVAFPSAQDNRQGLLMAASGIIINNPLDRAIGGLLFGGKQKVIDQGIVIAGGALNDMLERIVVGAYQTIKQDGGLFGSDKTFDTVVDVSDTFGKQFQLVIKSIADTVREGAKALGLLPADVDAAIAAYRIEETRISLKGLSAEDQQKELQAVFSKIFDGLAGSVVPYIGQFQRVGEGLGETLVRVATQVQVTEEGFRQLGITVDKSDPEKFAQIADGLITAAGGIDQFISGMQSFVANFASDEHKFQVASDALNSALSQVGLTLPATRDGMWDLMESLDETTAQGREQIATLLRLSDVANEYYNEIEKRADELLKKAQAKFDYVDFIGGLNGQGGGLSSVSPLLAEQAAILKWEQDTTRRANELARAAGLQGAATQDLALIQEIAAHRMVEAMQAIEEQSRDLVYRLRHNGQSLEEASNSASTAVESFGNAMTTTAERAQSAIDLLIGDKSPYGDDRKLEIARGGLIAGTVTQDQFLEIAKRLFGTTSKYWSEFFFAQQFPGRAAAGANVGGGGFASSSNRASENNTYTEAERRADAQHLAQNIVSLANAQQESYADVAARLDYSLSELAGNLGLSDTELTAYLDNLKAQENAVRDAIQGSAIDIVRALYDIANRTPPSSVDQGRSGHDTRPGPVITAGGSDLPPPPARGAAVGSRDDRSTDSAVLGSLTALREELRALREIVGRGNGDVVEAMRDNTDATLDVRRAITQRDLAGAMHDRR